MLLLPCTHLCGVLLLARLWYHWSQWQFLRQCVLPCHCVNTNSCHLVCTRFPHSLTVLLTLVFCSVSVEPTSSTLSTLHWHSIHILVKLFRSQWQRSIARWRKGAAFTAKMNAGFDDDEFTVVDVESRGSEPDKQSNDPPPEFTGTKPSEFKSYRKKVNLSLLFTRTPAQQQGPRVLSRLTGQPGMPATDWNQRTWPLPMEWK